MMTSVSRGAIFVNAKDVTIECDVEWHPQGVSHVASSVVSIPAIRHSILYLEGSHDPDMMSEVVPRFEPFERCCMAILFVGGRGKTTLHPTSPPPLLVNSDHHPLCQRVNATIFLGRGNPLHFFFGTFLCEIERTKSDLSIN